MISFDTLSIFFLNFDQLIELFNWVLKQKDAFVSAILFSFNLALLPVINININIRKKYLKTYIS